VEVVFDAELIDVERRAGRMSSAGITAAKRLL
jgi:hypothetical protein